MAITTTRTVVATNTYTSDVFKKPYKVDFMHLLYTSDATVGNRQLRAILYDSAGNSVFDSHAGAVQAASNAYHYTWMPGIYRETSFIDNSLQVPYPANLVIPPNHYFTVGDVNNVSAGDDMIISIQLTDANAY